MKKLSLQQKGQPARFHIVAVIFLAGIAGIFFAIVFRPEKISSPRTIALNPVSSPKTNALHNSVHSVKPSKITAPESQITAAPINQDNEEFVIRRTDELRDLAMTSDPNSLNQITSELDSRDPRIRKAALEAVVQFGSRDAIPALQAAIVHVDDPQEKSDIQDAINFLELPSMTEVANARAKENGGGF